MSAIFHTAKQLRKLRKLQLKMHCITNNNGNLSNLSNNGNKSTKNMSLRKSGEELFISKENQVRRKSRMIVPLRSHLECRCTFLVTCMLYVTRDYALAWLGIGRSEAGIERAELGRAAIGCSQCGQNPPV